MFLLSSHIVVPYLLKLFNCIFSAGVFPELWSKAVIIPIYKKGNPNDADNYRGISLTSVFSKIFTGILNKRLTAWTDTQEIITDEQAVFRKGYSTVDNAFVLHSVIHRHPYKSKKVYAAFIDFRKAFNSVKREILWNVLQKMVSMVRC